MTAYRNISPAQNRLYEDLLAGRCQIRRTSGRYWLWALEATGVGFGINRLTVEVLIKAGLIDRRGKLTERAP